MRAHMLDFHAVLEPQKGHHLLFVLFDFNPHFRILPLDLRQRPLPHSPPPLCQAVLITSPLGDASVPMHRRRTKACCYLLGRSHNTCRFC